MTVTHRDISRRRARRAGRALVILIFLFSLAGYVGFSPAVGPILVRRVVPRLFSSGTSAQEVTGGLLGGIGVRGLRIENLGDPPRQACLSAGSISFNLLNRFRPGAVLQAEDVALALPWFTISASAVESRRGNDLRARGVTVSGIAFLPSGSRVDFPECTLKFSYLFALEDHHRFEWKEACVSLPLSSLRCSGRSHNARLKVEIRPSTLHLMDVAYLLPKLRSAQPDGAIQVRGSIQGSLREPEIAGEANWEDVSVGHLHLVAGRAEGNARVYLRSKETTLAGYLAVIEGKLEVGEGRLSIKEGRLFFRNRRPVDPELKLVVEGLIGEHQVRVTADGLLSRPRLLLTSTPELAEGRLALLITTGKSWAQAAVESAARASPAGVSGSLMDYLFFQVGGGEFGKRFGLALAEVVYDPDTGEKGAVIRKTWANKFATLYGMTVHPAGVDHTLGLEYRLIDSLTIGEQQKFAGNGDGPPLLDGEKKIYLRWKQEF